MNGGKLPEGWVETPLENIVEILDSMRIPVNNKGVSGFTKILSATVAR